jgi:GGDEF domain-containing protein
MLTKSVPELPSNGYATNFENTIVTFGDSRITATASFGIAGFHGDESPDGNALVACVDTALYAAKHKGRNRIEFQ